PAMEANPNYSSSRNNNGFYRGNQHWLQQQQPSFLATNEGMLPPGSFNVHPVYAFLPVVWPPITQQRQHLLPPPPPPSSYLQPTSYYQPQPQPQQVTSGLYNRVQSSKDLFDNSEIFSQFKDKIKTLEGQLARNSTINSGLMPHPAVVEENPQQQPSPHHLCSLLDVNNNSHNSQMNPTQHCESHTESAPMGPTPALKISAGVSNGSYCMK
ncbi:hypothetical protein TYRP_018293, partial [Tyrophagus putrescentiae]